MWRTKGRGGLPLVARAAPAALVPVTLTERQTRRRGTGAGPVLPEGLIVLRAGARLMGGGGGGGDRVGRGGSSGGLKAAVKTAGWFGRVIRSASSIGSASFHQGGGVDAFGDDDDSDLSVDFESEDARRGVGTRPPQQGGANASAAAAGAASAAVVAAVPTGAGMNAWEKKAGEQVQVKSRGLVLRRGIRVWCAVSWARFPPPSQPGDLPTYFPSFFGASADSQFACLSKLSKLSKACRSETVLVISTLRSLEPQDVSRGVVGQDERRGAGGTQPGPSLRERGRDLMKGGGSEGARGRVPVLEQCVWGQVHTGIWNSYEVGVPAFLAW